MIDVTVTRLNALRDSITRRFPAESRAEMDAVTDDARTLLLPDLIEYPEGPAPGEWGAWVAEHENAAAIRGAFFSKVRRGEWSGRSGGLAQGWATGDLYFQPGAGDFAAQIRITNTYAGAEFVQLKEMQARFHTPRWKNTVDAVLRKHNRALRKLYAGAIDRAWKRAAAG